MKTKPNTVLIVMALLAYWAGLCNASAFYDPGMQRWPNHDPLGEPGFELVANKPGPKTGRTLMEERNKKLLDSLRMTSPAAAEAVENLVMRMSLSSGFEVRQQAVNPYTFVLNDPNNQNDPLGLQCLLNCFPFYTLFNGHWTIGSMCYPVDDGNCPKCPCSNPFNLPTANHWWIIGKPVSPGTYVPGFDPCSDQPPGIRA